MMSWSCYIFCYIMLSLFLIQLSLLKNSHVFSLRNPFLSQRSTYLPPAWPLLSTSPPATATPPFARCCWRAARICGAATGRRPRRWRLPGSTGSRRLRRFWRSSKRWRCLGGGDGFTFFHMFLMVFGMVFV